MSREDRVVLDLSEHTLRPMVAAPRPVARTRTIVVQKGSGWIGLGLLTLSLLLLAVILLGHRILRELDQKGHASAAAMTRFERKVEQLESGLAFDSRRRLLLLGMRDHILRVNPRVGLAEAYRYAELALAASEKYPAVDPLLLLAIGTVESRTTHTPPAPPTLAASTRSGRPPDGCSSAASAGTTTIRSSTTRSGTRRPRPCTWTSSSPPTATRRWSWPNTTAAR